MKDYTNNILEAYNTLGFFPRDNQLEIINNIVNSFLNEGYTNIILNAPTGSGKSIIAMVTQLVMRNLSDKDNKSNIIMNTNVLIDQYINSFSHLDITNFSYRKGANNYVCPFMSAKRGFPVGADLCVGSPKDNCPEIYYKKCEFCKIKQLQQISKCVVSNYSYWMSANLFSPKKNFVFMNIFDECHTMNDVFSSFASLSITTSLIDYLITLCSEKENSLKEELTAIKNSLKRIEIKDEFDFKGQRLSQQEKLEISREIGKENYNHFRNTIEAISPILYILGEKLKLEKESLDKKIKEISNSKPKEPKESKKLKDLKNELLKKKNSKETLTKEDILIDHYINVSKSLNKISNINYQINLIKDDEEILFEKINDNNDIGIKATPVFIKKYWSALNNSTFNLFMSATVTKEYIERTIDLEGKTKFILIPSLFPRENKLIVDYKSQRLNYETMKNPQVINNIIKSCSDIVEANSNVNGIILATTFELTHKIAEKIRQNNNNVKVFEHKQGEKISDILSEFKQYNKISVLISPSLWEGISLDDDASRYQIICKTPYGSLASKRNRFIQVRLPEIYQQQALLTLIQGFGRSVRNKEDFCVTYCLDETTIQEINRPYNIWKNDFTYQRIR